MRQVNKDSSAHQEARRVCLLGRWAFHLGRQTETEMKERTVIKLWLVNEQSTFLIIAHTHHIWSARGSKYIYTFLLLARDKSCNCNAQAWTSKQFQEACGQPQDDFRAEMGCHVCILYFL